jgi:phosphoribosylformylglycinamidine synthase
MHQPLKAGIVVFPGSNCDQDCHDAITKQLGGEAVYLWHDQTDLQGVNLLILPGGFSYGDYLRCGAIARFSPIMKEIKAFAKAGNPVIGICNGFQILTEAGLLPGTLLRNRSLRFQCDRRARLVVENAETRFTVLYRPRAVVEMPVAHAEGNFYAEPEVIDRLERNGQVVFRYVEDVNGSVNRIAGIINESGNVLGMMPHPERNLWADPAAGWAGDGRPLFDSLYRTITGEARKLA